MWIGCEWTRAHTGLWVSVYEYESKITNEPKVQILHELKPALVHTEIIGRVHYILIDHTEYIQP